ncbi:discoidin domain-containing protein [Microbispora sp. NPDC046933]|uniref:discoidin domain-containing protein n=1 Tax=Microbispora sp. NPDC046933 TaxID=3155618 RepID=UPI0033E42865
MGGNVRFGRPAPGMMRVSVPSCGFPQARAGVERNRTQSDCYLRLTRHGGRMLKGQIALTSVRPTPPVAGGGGGDTNLARGKATAESGHTQNYAGGNAVDGDANSYWESPNNAFPQWMQVDLGAAATVGRMVLKLPPATAWERRTQTLSVQTSTDSSSFTTVAGPGGTRSTRPTEG